MPVEVVMAMVSCPECGIPARAESCACPACWYKLRTCAPRKLSVAAGAVMLGLTVGCGEAGPEPEPAYGIPFIDDDGDGYPTDVDCDDTDPAVHPDAVEEVGDGVDSNCDGDDDT